MRISEMIRTAFAALLSIVIAASLTLPARAQAVPRGVSFTDVAASALQSNLQLRAAAFDVAVARAQLTQAQGGAGPQAGLSSSYARIQDHPPQDSNIYAAGLAISYPLSTGGNAEARIRLAEANLRGAVATYERTRQQIRYTAEQTYLQGLLAGENVAAAVRALTTATESLRVAQARLRAGTVARVDVLQAEVAVANAEQTLVQAQTSLATAQAALNATLNLPLDTPLEPTDTLTPRPVEGMLSEALARAVRTRPDLVALQNQIGAAQAGIDLARSGGQPVVSLGAGYTVGNTNGLSPFSYGSWSLSLAVTLSVFDGGITQGKISEAQLKLEQLQVREAQARQQVELDVRMAWLALQRAAGELTAATKAVEQGRESLRLATARYQAGVGTSLELLSAQSGLALAEQSLASARYDQNVARIQFILAIGAP
jgi:outer membrane protein TolC